MAGNLIERVLKTVRTYDMLKSGDSVLVCVSGGPDSVFLLHALSRLKNKLRLKNITVCNLDHGLRGRESREDSLFVKTLAEELGSELIHKKIRLKRSKKLSTEESAREARYDFFKEAARMAGAGVIATGHTLDDQAETILMRFIKGSSLKGIVGIAPRRVEGGRLVVRPLLELTKDEIRRFLDGNGMQYRLDRTNLEPIYFRNVVRSEIIPFLERYNPQLKRVLFRLSEHLREDLEFIKERMADSQGIISRDKKGNIELRLKDIIVQPGAIQKEVLRDALAMAGGIIKKLSFKHWKEVEGLIKHKAKGNSVDLPGGIRAARTASSIIFYKI